jgi:glucose-6-phosphate 1-dehydrogenase
MQPIVSAGPPRAGMVTERKPDPNTVVIFGATGDLTHRKLMPALYNLACARLLPRGFSVVAFARRPYSDDRFREEMREAVNRFSRTRPVRPEVWDEFAQGIFYLQSDFSDPTGYQRLAQLLAKVDEERGTCGNYLYYLATPPSAYPEIIRRLGEAGLARRKGERKNCWGRIIIEKPFGYDLSSAQALNRQVHEAFDEEQIYRIDHYLGKETVQNILVFRLANGIFEPLWNRRYVDHVQITVAETIGVEGRGAYYDQAGVLRDIVQNHMLQLLALVAMEPPISFEADYVRDEKVKVLKAIRPFTPETVKTCIVRGQYGPGIMDGVPVPGYRQEPNVAPDSTTETYVALKLWLDTWRWADVPFYLRSGKRLPKRATEISIHFKQAPLLLFGQSVSDEVKPNLLVLKIQPDEGISLRFGAKVPGPTIHIQPVNMDFRYGTSFGSESPDAYERLLLDCMLGDSTLFTRNDEIEAAWGLVTQILEAWQGSPPPDFPNYPAGSWGPLAAHELMARDGRAWRTLDDR